MGNLSSAFEKADKSLRHDEFHFRVGNSFPNCQQLYRVARNVKGLSQDEGWADFCKNFRALSLTKAFRMNLISPDPSCWTVPLNTILKKSFQIKLFLIYE
jgi:hypothetical protein